jgi:hypothetical protein
MTRWHALVGAAFLALLNPEIAAAAEPVTLKFSHFLGAQSTR